MRPGACLCIHKVSPAESLRRLHFVGLPGWTAAGTVVGGLWVVEESKVEDDTLLFLSVPCGGGIRKKVEATVVIEMKIGPDVDPDVANRLV